MVKSIVFSEAFKMIKKLIVLVLICCLWLTCSEGRSVEFSFTQPEYRGVVNERALNAVVQTEVMMGMWLSNVTRDVHFNVMDNHRQFQANSNLYGNFIILELRATSLTQSEDVQIEAIASNLGLSTFCTVHVSVIDVNDFQPLFPTRPYAVSIPENTKIGSVIATVTATDSDRDFENTRFYYNLPEFSDYFAVHPTTGAVSLTSLLNAKTQSVHSIIIQATDRKAALLDAAQPKRTTLTVSVLVVNAHRPVMVLRDLGKFDVKDNNNRLYGILSIFDPDSGVEGKIGRPSITHCSVPGLLVIESHEEKDQYRIMFSRTPRVMDGTINATIQVVDRGNPPLSSRLEVSINLFDKKSATPVFVYSRLNFTVSEISPVHTQVGFVTAKLSSSPICFNCVQYSILSGNDGEYFRINPKTSLITTRKGLISVKKRSFTLRIAADNPAAISTARNITMVYISVQDANDHYPVFTKQRYSASLPENSKVGSNIITVSAADVDEGENGSVVYSLVKTQRLPIDIDPFNGTIFTTAALDLDVLSKNTFDILVRARDSGFPFRRKSECLVAVSVVNANDNIPQFAKADCVVSVAIFTSVQTEIIQLEPIDIDRNPVVCSFLSGPKRFFEIDPKTCLVRLAVSLRDEKVGERLTLQVVASDGTHTSTPIEVVITVVESGEIEKTCRDTGAIGSFEETVSNLHGGRYDADTQLNQTSRSLNAHKPVVVPRKNVYTAFIKEDTAIGKVVYRIVAYDGDKGYNGKLWFTIVSGNDDSCFIVDTQSGVISLALPLDRERKSFYLIVIKISDLGSPSKFTKIRIRFNVVDVNDNFPVFSKNIYSVEIPEDVSVGHRINSGILATDLDQGENARIQFSLFPSHQSNDFSIEADSGVLLVLTQLDREKIPSYNFTIIASDSSTTHPLTSTSTLIIRLSDVNDNAPHFHQQLHRIQISEDLPINTVVFWLQARDPDLGENGEIRYSLTAGVTDKNDRSRSYFRVDDRTGVIRLSKPLNARVQSSYNITARARDLKKLYSTCYIEVEVMPVNKNLRAPYFPLRYTKLEILEGAPIGTELGAVNAIDEDLTEPENSVRYYIRDGTGLGAFSVDSFSGAISSRRNLDFESEQFYWLTVVAVDQAPIPLSGHIFILVKVTDENDNSPEALLPFYAFSVLENSPPSTFIGQVQARDPDSGPGGNVTYSMKAHTHFEIDPRTGVIRTSRRRNELDRENLSADKLSFDVIVSDFGTPPLCSAVRVRINLTDVNDNSPRFSPFLKKKILLPKRSDSQTPENLTRIVAWDNDAGSNGRLVYFLNSSKSFKIDSETGVIQSTGVFSENELSVLRISCKDNGKNQLSSKFRLEIDWLQNIPHSVHPPRFINEDQEPILYFEHVDLCFIEEESPSGRVIRVLEATDVDSEYLWFSIIDGNDDDMFAVSPDHVLYVAGDPDAETKNFYNITVQVSDGYNHAVMQMIVRIGDVNDHRPVFESNFFNTSIPENLPPNSHVINLSAIDGDVSEKNKDFIYKIRESVDPASASKFRITPAGDIFTTVALNREAQREHILLIEVNDQGVPASLQSFCRLQVTVTDVNEHPPIFSSPFYRGTTYYDDSEISLGADDTDERVVVTVQATDLDYGINGKISYSITAGNNDRLWKINPSSGEISLARKLGVDDRAQSSNLTITARDGAREPRSSTVQVQIEILKDSDVISFFETETMNVTVLESSTPGSFVAKLSSSTRDSASCEITAGNEAQKFIMNPHSRLITLDDELDREETSSYVLNISCASMSSDARRTETSVVVNVADVNDNRPRFLVSAYDGYLTLVTTRATSSLILNKNNQPLAVQALDLDEGRNGKLVYRIADEREDIKRRFSIDFFNGKISAKLNQGATTLEWEKEYEFKVEASDLGNPQLSSANHVTVTVHVIDDDITDSILNQQRYNFSLYLPAVDGMLVNRIPSPYLGDGMKISSVPIKFSFYGKQPSSAFKIDPSNGTIFLENSDLVRVGKKINLQVRVTDGKRVSTFSVSIDILELPDSSLKCSQDVFETNFMENSNQVKPLVPVTVANTKVDDHFRFAILNPHPGFKIGFTSGVVSTTGIPFNREEKDVQQLLIEVEDVSFSNHDSNNRNRSRCVVRVSIDDINDNAPAFESTLYRPVVQRKSLPGSTVIKVRALDLDYGQNSKLIYMLKNSPSRLFEINSTNGHITLVRTPLDAADVNITVRVHDEGTPRLWGSTTLFVTFVDQSTPVFTQLFYNNIWISESAQPYTVVTDLIKATASNASSVYITIEDGDSYQQFEIDSQEGTLRTLGKLDREERDIYRLRIRAHDSKSDSFADAEVEIKIVDVNDNFPVFLKPFYRAKIEENSGTGRIVTQVEAVDADKLENARVAYEIVDRLGFDGEYFHIDSSSGVVWTAKNLDYEKKETCSFIIRASDCGIPVRHTDVMVTVVVDDVNDNSPVFDKNSYQFDISKDASPGSFIGKVTASDADHIDIMKIKYSMSSFDADDMLSINSSTGVLILNRELSSYNSPSSIHFNVTASDGLFITTSTVTLLVNKNYSELNSFAFEKRVYRFEIPENQPEHTIVGKIKAVGSEPLIYSIASNTIPSDLFHINEETGTITTSQIIDRESLILYSPESQGAISLLLSATNEKGLITTAKVFVEILDQNDNFPVFGVSRYQAVLVPARMKVGQRLLQITARDLDSGRNGQVSYGWGEQSSFAQTVLNLNQSSGVISILETSIDAEMLQFFVEAFDNGESRRRSSVSVSVVIVTGSVSVPEFSQNTYSVLIADDAAVGSKVFAVHADVEHATVSYAIPQPYSVVGDHESNFSMRLLPFAIDDRTGIISLNGSLDSKVKDVYYVTIAAYLTESPEVIVYSQLIVYVTDGNENDLEFEADEYHVTVLENSKLNSSVAAVQAWNLNQDDHGRVTYKFERSKDKFNNYFAINNESGEIYLIKDLDREKESRYNLTVLAFNGGDVDYVRSTSTCHVIVDVIDVNDRPPKFVQQNSAIKISESVSRGYVTSWFMNVRDEDEGDVGHMSFYIVEGDPNNHFTLVQKRNLTDNHTVDLALQVLKELDRERQAVYYLNLVASDSVHSSNTSIKVVITDVNDNIPVCNQLSYYGSIPENISPNSFILRLHSSDADTGKNGKVLYSLSGENSNLFRLGLRTGKLYTASTLDREIASQHHLVATASDNSGQSCSCQIHITVEDVNDNPPMFTSASLHATVQEDKPINSFIHQLQGYDPDIGENGSFIFSLGEDSGGQFYVEPLTGVVILQEALDRETVSSYDVTVQIADKGTGRLSSNAVLHVQVSDVNDNPPVFDKLQYDVAVKEDSVTGERIAQVTARSLDTGVNAKLIYAITRGNEHEKFAIDQETGEVTLIEMLDYESDQSYILKISARDSSVNPLSSDTTLRVNVIDVNDNAPQFTSTKYQVKVPENSPLGHKFFSVIAIDQDIEVASNITYRLLTENSPFDLNSISGEFTVSTPGLDYEKVKSYILKIEVSDNSQPPLSSQTMFEVNVIDVNDNRPQFSVSTPLGGITETLSCSRDVVNCTVFVDQKSKISLTQGLVLFNATDADGESNAGPFRFNIVKGNKKKLFYFDQNNILKTNKPLKVSQRKQGSTNRKRSVYRLLIEVEDSGFPIPLKSLSALSLNVVVIKEGEYAPQLTPHQVEVILTPESRDLDERLLTLRLNATDEDIFDQDRIRYYMAQPNDFELYMVDSLTGALTSRSRLSPGLHEIPIRVSDGFRESEAVVPVSVSSINQQVLKKTVSITFNEISTAEVYLSVYHSYFLRQLNKLLVDSFDAERDFVFVSLYHKGNSVKLFFVVRKPPSTSSQTSSFYSSSSLKNLLTSNRVLIEESLRLRITSIEATACSSDFCSHGRCEQTPTPIFSPDLILPISTNHFSLVTSKLGWSRTCKCPIGTTEPNCEPICSIHSNPCPTGSICNADTTEREGYRCDTPNPSSTIMTFTGKSVARFVIKRSRRNLPFHITMRMRTFKSNSTIFLASGPRHSAKLEVKSGFLVLTFDCGSGTQKMTQNFKLFNDGDWHNISIEPLSNAQTSCGYKLTADHSYVAVLNLPGVHPTPNFTTIAFGSSSGSEKSRQSYQKRDLSSSNYTPHGFVGCLKKVLLNNNRISLQPSSGMRLESNNEVTSRCRNNMIDMGACSHDYCIHNSTCVPLSDGLYECDCPNNYMGENCELFDLCASVTCNDNGYCFSDEKTARCNCYDGFTGEKCEVAIACQAIDHCRNGGKCNVDQSGQPLCFCDQGWTGLHCEIDVNECTNKTVQQQCGGAKNCFNFDGGFACNCKAEKQELRGYECQYIQDLKMQDHSKEASQPSLLVLIIALVFGGTFVLFVVIIVVVCAKKRKKKNERKYSSGSRPSLDLTPVGHFTPARTTQQPHVPQVPQRPIEYTRSSTNQLHSISSEAENQEHRSPLIGLVHPQVAMTSYSIPSECSSVHKTPYMLQDYERIRMNGSAASSMHLLPPSRSSSTADAPSQQWDIIDSSQQDVFLSPSPGHLHGAHVYGRGATSSPDSHQSFSSSITNRSYRSQRSDALSGHYNVGRRRRQKQLLQMIALKEKNEKENMHIQRVLSHLVSQELAEEEIYDPSDSRNSSLRSSLSQYRSESADPRMTPESKFSHSRPMNRPSTSDVDVIKPNINNKPSKKSRVLRNDSPVDEIVHSRLPSDFELQPLEEVEEDPPASTSLLPLQHQVTNSYYKLSSTASESSFQPIERPEISSSSTYASHRVAPHRSTDIHSYNHHHPSKYPLPPQRLDSKRLSISSFSDDEEEAIHHHPNIQKSIPGQFPVEKKPPPRMEKYKKQYKK